MSNYSFGSNYPQVKRPLFTVKQPRGQPKSKWQNYIPDLACSGLGVKPAELAEVATRHETTPNSIGADVAWLPKRKRSFKHEWMNTYRICN